MYTPAPDGIEKITRSVCYTEASSPADLQRLVYCFWELKTDRPLADDFLLHATPDACVDIMFNEIDTAIAGVTSLRTTYETLNLGKQFHYVGIQFLPGVWRGDRNAVAHEYIGDAYTGSLPLVAVNHQMAGLDFPAKQHIMARLVRELADTGVVSPDPAIENILGALDSIKSVADMALAAGLSTRQLRRRLHQATGFTPHDLLKILRLQRPLNKQPDPDAFADQSHFIRSFRSAVGHTPTEYAKKFG